MDPERLRAIASKGGSIAHQRGVAHKFNSQEAREAGRKGGESTSRNREYMSYIGRKGGQSSAQRLNMPQGNESGPTNAPGE